MQNQEKMKKTVFPLVIFFINLLKMIVFVNTANLGFDFYKNSIDFSYKSFLFWGCALVLSGLLAVVYTMCSKKHTELTNILFVLLMLDPSVILVVRMTQCLLIYVLVYLVLVNELREKPFVPREFLLVLFSFAASLVFAHSVFSFVPFTIAAYLIARQAATAQKTRTVLSVTAALVFVILGIVLNKQLQLADINMKLNALPVSDSNIRILLVLSVPFLVFTFCYIYSSFTGRTQKTKKKSKKETQVKDISSSYIMPIALAAVYVMSLIGGVMGYVEALCMINAASPLLIMISLHRNDENTKRTMEVMAGFVNKHIFAFAVAAACLFYIAIRIIQRLDIMENTISYLITSI